MQETWETRVWSLGWEDPLEEEMAAHFGVLVGTITWREKVGYSLRGHKELGTVEHTPTNCTHSSSWEWSSFNTTSSLWPWALDKNHRSSLLLITYIVISSVLSVSHSWWYERTYITPSDKMSSFFLFAVLVTQSCLTLCSPMDCIPPGPWVLGILQARTLEWVAIPFSMETYWPRDQTQVSCIASRFFTVRVTFVLFNNLGEAFCLFL